MGLVNVGAPEKEVDFLMKIMELDVFVEGGTYLGNTARSMSAKFRKVYTIEKSDVIFSKAKQNLKNIPNITMIKGDTRDHLKDIVKNNNNILFWLDAHWSTGDTYGAEDECPLIEELKIIFEYPKNYAILIDDARYFLAPPPYPHNFKSWPSMKDIFNTMPQNWSFIAYEDVIYLYPSKIEESLKDFIQKDITEKLVCKNKKISSFFQRVFKKMGVSK